MKAFNTKSLPTAPDAVAPDNSPVICAVPGLGWHFIHRSLYDKDYAMAIARICLGELHFDTLSRPAFRVTSHG